MSKQKTLFSCSSCSYQTVKWLGCCPECKSWDSFVQSSGTQPGAAAFKGTQRASSAHATTMMHLSSISNDHQPRMLTGINEWDRVVGGGIMPSSLIVLTGDPGIGKSTLLLQMCNELAASYRVFYFSTEESLAQVKLRAARLGCTQEQLLFSDNAELDTIIATCTEHKPAIAIIDSIQNCYVPHAESFPGSVGQLRESTFRLMRLAKEYNITILLTGHITKEGTMAGPKTLEHMVDAVFYLQGEDRWQTRVLRSVKNRFGTVNELGFFTMEEHGLVAVPDINEYLLQELSHAPGATLVSTIEGSRPLLLELQALTIESKLAMPQRVVSGIDQKQVVLIAAILEKYLHIRLSAHDIFFKVSGGFKVKDSAIDMGIALALLSSYFQQPLPEGALALGEISLTGQIKPINHANLFIKEAEKFGITQLLGARNQKIESSATRLRGFASVYDLLSLFTP